MKNTLLLFDMNTSVLLNNLNQLITQFSEQDILAKYASVIPLIDSYRATPNEDTESALDEQLNLINEAHRTVIDVMAITPHSQQFIEKLKLNSIIGRFIQESFGKTIKSDYFLASKWVDTLVTDTQQFIQKAEATVNNLIELGEKPQQTTQTILSIELPYEKKQLDTKELQELLSQVQSIVYYYSRTSDVPKESTPPTITNLSKSSPLTMDITWEVDFSTVILLLSFSIAWIVNKKNQSLQVKKTKLYILDNLPKEAHKAIDKVLEEHSEELPSESEIDSHTEDLKKLLKRLGRTVKPDEINFLKKGVEGLVALYGRDPRLNTYSQSEKNMDDSQISRDIHKNTRAIFFQTEEYHYSKKELNAGAKLMMKAKTDDK